MFVHPARYVASLHGGIEVSGTIYRTQILDNKQKTQHSSLKMAREEPRKVSRLSYFLAAVRCAKPTSETCAALRRRRGYFKALSGDVIGSWTGRARRSESASSIQVARRPGGSPRKEKGMAEREGARFHPVLAPDSHSARSHAPSLSVYCDSHPGGGASVAQHTHTYMVHV